MVKITNVILIHCSIVKNNYEQKLGNLHISNSNKYKKCYEKMSHF